MRTGLKKFRQLSGYVKREESEIKIQRKRAWTGGHLSELVNITDGEQKCVFIFTVSYNGLECKLYQWKDFVLFTTLSQDLE